MGLFGGNSFTPDRSREVLLAEKKIVRENISSMNKGSASERLADARQEEKIARLKKGFIGKSVRGSEQVGVEAGRAAAVGMRQQVDFSREQDNLREMFGHGDKIWGTNMEPVRLNNDLNSSRSNPYDETSSMFGWGPQRERSGLF